LSGPNQLSAAISEGTFEGMPGTNGFDAVKLVHDFGSSMYAMIGMGK
jgi:hypothetical protein